jgi:hypothetical protein
MLKDFARERYYIAIKMKCELEKECNGIFFYNRSPVLQPASHVIVYGCAKSPFAQQVMSPAIPVLLTRCCCLPQFTVAGLNLV